MIQLRYIVNVLEDAKIYLSHADKTEIDESDIRLAIQNRMDHLFISPPPRDVNNHLQFSIVIPPFCLVSH
jgi:hypothetical protein